MTVLFAAAADNLSTIGWPRAGGYQQSIPRGRRIARHARFGDRRNLRHCARALHAGHAEHAQPSLLHVRRRRKHAREHERDLAGEHVHQRLACAFIRNVRELYTGSRFEQRARKMARAPVAARSIGERMPGFAFASAIRSFTLFAGREGCTTSRKGASASSDTGTRSFCGSKGRLEYRLGIDRVAAGHDENRVTVGWALRDRGRTDRTGGAGAILDDDVLPQRVVHLARRRAGR